MNFLSSWPVFLFSGSAADTPQAGGVRIGPEYREVSDRRRARLTQAVWDKLSFREEIGCASMR